MEILILVLLMYVMFKLTGFVFKVVGKAFGLIFGIIGYVLLGVLGMAAFGMAVVFLPVTVIIGIFGITALAARTVF